MVRKAKFRSRLRKAVRKSRASPIGRLFSSLRSTVTTASRPISDSIKEYIAQAEDWVGLGRSDYNFRSSQTWQAGKSENQCEKNVPETVRIAVLSDEEAEIRVLGFLDALDLSIFVPENVAYGIFYEALHVDHVDTNKGLALIGGWVQKLLICHNVFMRSWKVDASMN